MTHFAINHISDVLPHIEGRSDFIVAHKEGYSVIDYVYALPDSFDHPARLECRGIKFAEDGRILARPLHKFMNVGQTPDTQPDKLDFSTPHTITEKLDGSMIHPAIVNGEVVFMTRMGRTDVALKAERHLTKRLATSARGMLEDGVTPNTKPSHTAFTQASYSARPGLILAKASHNWRQPFGVLRLISRTSWACA